MAIGGDFEPNAYSSEHSAKAAAHNRKIEFVSFLKAWSVEINRRHLEPGGFAKDPEVFKDGLPAFVAAAESIRQDFRLEDKKKFDELVQKLASSSAHKPQEVTNLIDQLVARVEQ